MASYYLAAAVAIVAASAVATPIRRTPDEFTMGTSIEHANGDKFVLTNEGGDMCFSGRNFYACDESNDQMMMWYNNATFSSVSNPDACPEPIEENVYGGCHVDCEKFSPITAVTNCDASNHAWMFETIGNESMVHMIDSISGQCAVFGDELEGEQYLTMGDCDQAAVLKYEPVVPAVPQPTGALEPSVPGTYFQLEKQSDRTLCWVGGADFVPCDNAGVLTWVDEKTIAKRDAEGQCLTVVDSLVQMGQTCEVPEQWALEVAIDDSVMVRDLTSGMCATYDYSRDDDGMKLDDCISGAWLYYVQVNV